VWPQADRIHPRRWHRYQAATPLLRRRVRADALEYLKTADFSQYDLIWASPPRQFATSLRSAPGKIENIETALPWLIDPATLCGSMFNLETHPYPEG
jgi:hypothetical protein